jgi:hypothetical protein
MREVTKDEFFAAIGNQNVHPSVQGDWPYTSRFLNRQTGREAGRIEEFLPPGKFRPARRYLLPE